MRNRRKSILIAGVFLAAILMLVWWVRPRSFLDVLPMDQAEKFYVWTSSGQFCDAHPDREELEELLKLLESAKLRPEKWTLKPNSIKWDRDEWYFGFSCSCSVGAGWVEVAGCDLGTDGMVYTTDRSWLGLLPYRTYRLTDCDMDALKAELFRILDIP